MNILEAAKLALEALEQGSTRHTSVVTDLRAAIAEHEAKNPKWFIMQKQNAGMVQVYPPIEMGEAERVDE